MLQHFENNKNNHSRRHQDGVFEHVRAPHPERAVRGLHSSGQEAHAIQGTCAAFLAGGIRATVRGIN